jgi:putative MATE family efflux protein
MTKNLTVGNPALLILGFSIPLFIGNLFQQFYSMADAFIVGQTIGMGALAAVGCTGGLTFLILGFVYGFTSGATILTSQRFGAGDARGVRRSFAVSILLCGVMALVLTAVSVAYMRPLLVLMHTPPDILEGANDYLVILLWGTASMTGFCLVQSVMRAVGDSRTPLYFLIIACLINVALDYLFILKFHAGVKGAAWATVVSQVLSVVFCLPALKRFKVLQLTREDWRVSWPEVWEHVRVAFPMGFQLSVIAIGVVGLQFAMNELGTEAVAAFTASIKIEGVAAAPMSSFGVAMATYTAQNYGAGKIRRIWVGVLQCALLSGGISVVIGIVFAGVGHRLAAWFISDNAHAIALAHTYLTVNGLCYVFLALLFIFRQSLQGLGNSVIPTVAGGMELAMRILSAVFLVKAFGFLGVCWASPLAWIGALVPLGVAWLVCVRRMMRESLDPASQHRRRRMEQRALMGR